MWAVIGATVACLSVMFAVAAALLWLRDRWLDPPPTPEQLEHRKHEHQQQLLHPDWDVVADEFGGRIPKPLQTLYGDRSLLLAENLEIREDLKLAAFVPANDDAFDPEQWFDPPDDAFVFAVSTFGDPLFVRTGEQANGLPVYVLFHDGGEIERIAEALEQFIERMRSPAA